MKKISITKCLGIIAAIGLAFALKGTVLAASGQTVPYYSAVEDGGWWTGTQYYLSNGTLAKDCFFFDGFDTYYLQTDGTPMKDRLTYHPDGVHIIYFDSNGHEKFSAFQNCPSVGYTCYFDSNGYMYKDVTTFANGNTYYLDANGKLQNNGWFQFANGRDYGFANSNGALMDDGWGYDPWGRVVYYHWNGMVARGLITDKVYNYSMDTTDGHYVGQFPYMEPTSPTAPTKPTTPAKTTITVEGYTFSIDAMNAASASFSHDSLAGTTVYDGGDYAAVFNATDYLSKHSDVKAAGYTTETAILHFVNDGMRAKYQGNSFSAEIYKANYYDELNPKYGDKWVLYYYDYLCYGKAAGKVGDQYLPDAKRFTTGKTITVEGYTFSVDAINAASAPCKHDIWSGNTVYDGIDYAAVFHAHDYLGMHSDVKDAGYTHDNAILHFVFNGMNAHYQAGDFSAVKYRANYYDELNPKYGHKWILYYYDYLCYGKAAGKEAEYYLPDAKSGEMYQ